jgi:hypothetical protein
MKILLRHTLYKNSRSATGRSRCPRLVIVLLPLATREDHPWVLDVVAGCYRVRGSAEHGDVFTRLREPSRCHHQPGYSSSSTMGPRWLAAALHPDPRRVMVAIPDVVALRGSVNWLLGQWSTMVPLFVVGGCFYATASVRLFSLLIWLHPWIAMHLSDLNLEPGNTRHISPAGSPTHRRG